MKILRLKDRVKVKLEELEFKIAPLSYQQQIEIDSCKKIVSGDEVDDYGKKVFLMLKYSLKEVKGIKLHNGKPYKIELDDDGNITDECVNEIIVMPLRDEIINAVHKTMMQKTDEIDAKEVEIEVGK